MDLTGGLGNEPIDIKALRAEAMEDAAPSGSGECQERNRKQRIRYRGQDAHQALPSPRAPRQAKVDLADWQNVSARPEDEIVIVSVGELGPWGSGRTRFEAELGIHSDGQVDLSAGAVLELAWNMGLLTWNDQPSRLVRR